MRCSGVLVVTMVLAARVFAQSSHGLFVEITEEAKLDFRHDPGASGGFFMPEIMGSGGALFDYDNDGDLDIYLIAAWIHAFITDEIDEWHGYLVSKGVEMRGPLAIRPNHATRGFVAYDPEGYYLEFETFLEHPENTRLLRALAKIEQ